MSFTPPIAKSFTDEEDKLVEQQELFKLGMEHYKSESEKAAKENSMKKLKEDVICEIEKYRKTGKKTINKAFINNTDKLIILLETEIGVLQQRNYDLAELAADYKEQVETHIIDLEDVEKKYEQLKDEHNKLTKKFDNVTKEHYDEAEKIKKNDIIRRNISYIFVFIHIFMSYMIFIKISN